MGKAPANIIAVAVALLLIVVFSLLPEVAQGYIGAVAFGWCVGGVSGKVRKGLYHG